MMFTLRNRKEAPEKRSTAEKPAKIVKVKGFGVATQAINTKSEKNVVILGVSLTQPYSHGAYVSQMLEAIKQKIQERSDQVCVERGFVPDWQLVILLSTAFDFANYPDVDIENASSTSLAKQMAAEQAQGWIADQAQALSTYSGFFTYTIMSGDPCLEGEEYQRILSVFEEAYKQGKIEQQTKSLRKIDSQTVLTDKAFYKLIKYVIDAYVARHSSKEMRKAEKADLQKRSEWIVLREYALIFMLSLRKVPSSFLDNISLTEANDIYFAYPFGDFGKEVCNLLRALCSAHLSGVDNIKLRDFCSEKDILKESIKDSSVSDDKEDTEKVAPSPLTQRNLSKLQELLSRQEDDFSQLSDTDKHSYLEFMQTFLSKHKYSFPSLTNNYNENAKPRTRSDLTDSSGGGSKGNGAATEPLTGSSCSAFSSKSSLRNNDSILMPSPN